MKRLLATLFLTLFSTVTFAVGVGPKPPSESVNPSRSNSVYKPPARLNIPDLDVAVIVLNPKLDEEDEQMRKKGIWPEVRKVESIRSAVRIKEALVALNQFENIVVAPSLSVSSDLYLDGKIERSTTEEMEIRWRLLDATGATWIKWRTDKYRVPLGWHERYYTPGVDAFSSLYQEIARSVRKRLDDFAKEHTRTQTKNAKLKRRGKPATELSELETIAEVRDLVMARFFSPGIYEDTLVIDRRKEQYRIAYQPDKSTEEWVRITTFTRKDQEVTKKFDSTYGDFFDEVNTSYEQWLNELYPYARETRRNKAQANRNMVVGSIVLLATLAAGVDAADTGVQDRILASGGVLGAGILAKGVMDKNEYKMNLALFDEMSRNYHDQFQPTNVDLEGKVVSLEGNAQQQFSIWRQLLKEIYDTAESDSYDIEVVKNNN